MELQSQGGHVSDAHYHQGLPTQAAVPSYGNIPNAGYGEVGVSQFTKRVGITSARFVYI